MNILIIGNGFDIAHGLPTTYKDFLKFLEQIKRIASYDGTVKDFQSPIEQTGYDEFSKLHKGVAEYIDRVIRDKENLHAKVMNVYKRNPNKTIDDIIKLSKNNIWIKWFNESKTFLNEGWIDFESEISRIVQQFEKMFLEIAHTELNTQILSEENKNILKLFDALPKNMLTEEHFNEYKSRMYNDLNGLTRCFELYLEDCVRNIENSILSPDIYDLKVDKILSFNYTDTYYRLYSCKNRYIDYDYIHGKSKIESTPANNMVLGIDEYLKSEECNINIDYIMFKKYYQRIHKTTGSVYKKWIEEIDKGSSEEHHVYIFGHSLAVTDKDVLNEILMNSKVKITIFYHDNESHGQQIANLVKVLGQDMLISMVYSSEPKIKFEIQKAMINKNDSEWQILNDRQMLWSSYNYCDDEIHEVIERITEKIKNKDLKYFYNQRNIISLFNAIIKNYRNIDISSFEEIAKSLYNPQEFIWFDSDDWNDVDFRGNIYPCNQQVSALINYTNEYNKQRCDEEIVEFDMNDLGILHHQINNSILYKDKAFELFDSLFSMFKKRENDPKLIWKCIYLLINKASLDEWKIFINNRMSTVNEIGKLRLIHMHDVIEEWDYNNSIYQDDIY